MSAKAPPMTQLDSKVALVTGASRGIGEAIARQLHAAGAQVVLCSRKLESVAQVADSLKERALALACDVSQPDAIEAMARRVKEEFGGVDILVNNAGIATSAPLKALTLEEWNRIHSINVLGTYLCTKAFLPEMIDQGWGRVINIASTAGLTGAKYISAYSASKHAVMGFTRSLADEVGAKGVTVNAICPGYVDTPLTDKTLENITAQTGRSHQESVQALTRMSPQKRLIEADEIAFWTLCLCDHRGRGMNGQAIVVDGGGLLA